MESAIQFRPLAARDTSARPRHRLAFGGLLLFTFLLYARPNEAFPEVFGEFPIAKIVAIAALLAYFISKLLAAERLTIWPIEFKMIGAIALLGIIFTPIAASPSDSLNVLTDSFL